MKWAAHTSLLPYSGHLAAGTESFTFQARLLESSTRVDSWHLQFIFLSPKLEVTGAGKRWAADSSFLLSSSNRISHAHTTGFPGLSADFLPETRVLY